MSKRNHKLYRKIYEQHYGPIPVDELGRTYDIHHVDGDHTNNEPTNLIALSIKEHYNLHFSQGDWGESWSISLRMKISPEEKSEISRASNAERVAAGTHNFLDGEAARKYQNEKIKDGTHAFLRINKGKDNPGYYHTVRTWMNINTGQIVEMTNHELRTTFNLKSGAVSRVVHGKLNKTGGWKIIFDPSKTE